MTQDLQLPLLQPFIRLAEANMTLFSQAFSAGKSETASGSRPWAPGVGMQFQLLQGLAKNQVEFWADLGRSSTALFANGRGGLVTLANEI